MMGKWSRDAYVMVFHISGATDDTPLPPSLCAGGPSEDGPNEKAEVPMKRGLPVFTSLISAAISTSS